MSPWNCDEKLWRTDKGKIVKDGDIRAAFLVATPGMVLDKKPVIEPFQGPKVEAPEDANDEKAEQPAEDKSLDQDEDKELFPDEDKSARHSKHRR